MSFALKLFNWRFILFTFILAIKGSLAWYVVFDDGPSWETMYTEIPFFWIVFCLIEWFASRRKLHYYMIVNLLLTVLFFAVLMYYKYYGIIVTYHALSQADKVTAVGNSTYSLMDPYYLLIFVDIFVLAFLLVWWKRKAVRFHLNFKLRPVRKTTLTVLFAVSVALCIFNVWPNKASMNENKKAEEMGILNYEVYTIFADTTEDEEFVEMEDITQQAVDKLKVVTPPASPQFAGAAKGKNVIIVQMESFQNFLLGLKVNGQEVTPNMNRLAKEDFHFNNFYTMVGQGTTSDAEYVVNTSLYVPKHAAATDHYVDKAIPSMPKLLRDAGYDTATFHTNAVEFWNRTELYKSLGWDRYYDKTYFGDDDHIAFGASDEVLFSKTLDKLEEMDQADKPFYAQIISMSSHHPFEIPEGKSRIKLPEEYDGTLVGRYLEAQSYSDYALGQLIDRLKSDGLWDDSVVLFYGDHQGLPLYSLDNKERDLMQTMLGHEYGYTDMFNIPLLLHAKGVTYPKVIEETGGQVDILPTVANLTGVSLAGQLHFGQDLLNQKSNLLPMRHFLPTGSFVENKNLFLPGVAYDDGVNYSLEDNGESTQGASEEEYSRALELLHLSDSYVAQLPDK